MLISKWYFCKYTQYTSTSVNICYIVLLLQRTVHMLPLCPRDQAFLQQFQQTCTVDSISICQQGQNKHRVLESQSLPNLFTLTRVCLLTHDTELKCRGRIFMWRVDIFISSTKSPRLLQQPSVFFLSSPSHCFNIHLFFFSQLFVQTFFLFSLPLFWQTPLSLFHSLYSVLLPIYVHVKLMTHLAPPPCCPSSVFCAFFFSCSVWLGSVRTHD